MSVRSGDQKEEIGRESEPSTRDERRSAGARATKSSQHTYGRLPSSLEGRPGKMLGWDMVRLSVKWWWS